MPDVGEELLVNCDYSCNGQVEVVMKGGEIFGHLPRTISRVSFLFVAIVVGAII